MITCAVMHGGQGKVLLDQLVEIYYKAAAAINLSGHVVHVSS